MIKIYNIYIYIYNIFSRSSSFLNYPHTHSWPTEIHKTFRPLAKILSIIKSSTRRNTAGTRKFTSFHRQTNKINEIATTFMVEQGQERERIFTLCAHCDSRNSLPSMEISTPRIITLDSSVFTTLSLPARSPLSPRIFLHQTLLQPIPRRRRRRK